jgi:hypothetical protein
MTQEQISTLKQIREAFQWTWDNMATPHTSDHFNVPANGIQAIDNLIEQPASPAATVRGAEEITTACEAKYDKFFGSGYWEDQYKKDIVIFATQFYNEYASQSGYTRQQVSDAWDRGQSYGYAQCQHDHGGMSSDEWNYVLDKQTFLNSIKTPEIK